MIVQAVLLVPCVVALVVLARANRKLRDATESALRLCDAATDSAIKARRDLSDSERTVAKLRGRIAYLEHEVRAHRGY